MTYQEALEYLDSLTDYEKIESFDYGESIRLDRARRLAERLGNPQRGIKSLHIAGSKGKGSTACIAYSILQSAGYRVGLYTSPHLASSRERIRVNGELIAEDDFARLTRTVKEAAAEFSEAEKPTFFEVYTALAFLYFREKNVDFAVYEVGLGGRLDATNLVEPLVSAITPISYEHTQKLGNTLKEIAGEKAGIIKEGSICVSSVQEKEALETIEERAAARGASLALVGRDIFVEELAHDSSRTLFNVFGRFGEYPHLETGLLGDHQLINAATAIGMIEALRGHGIFVPLEAIREGVKAARWEGRLEVVSKNPLIVLDGAQNKASAEALARAVKKHFKYDKLLLILGVSKDKDIRGMCRALEPIADHLFLTRSSVRQRAMEPRMIIEALEKPALKERAVMTDNAKEALGRALDKAGRGDLILVTGSLFLVGEARALVVS